MARELFFKKAANLAHRALALAKAYPDSAEATEALAWMFSRIPAPLLKGVAPIATRLTI